ncbi:MAG: ATP-binding cassette domain-containing protein [Magnetococcales bacterium]|nr:ATP-binding cassette domain-containing protein [Magnetococcales bacterium]MBF0115393.1 ATP-binding cassette domain-containing protein [Magnetococcales bacterium]
MIRFDNVAKTLDGRQVLDGLNLEIPAHKITAIIGISGGGKSVTLKHMVGLMRPDRGDVWVGDQPISRLSGQKLNAVRRRFSLLFQEGALFDSLNVTDNVAFPLRETTALTEVEIRHRVETALQEVNLAGMGHKFPDELSGGMKKRAALARALVTQPEIILLDEPTAGLDPIIENAIHYLICDTYMRTRYTIVCISHAVPAIFDWCHHVVVLHRGRVLASGPSLDIRNSTDPTIKQFISGDLDGPIQVI